MRRTMILTAFILGFSSSLGFAEEPADAAKRIVQVLGEQTVAAAKIEDMDERRKSLAVAATPAMDFNAIGAGVLAHTGVKVPTGMQAEVMDGVINYVARQIIGEIERVRPEQAKVGASTAKNDQEVRVGMLLTGVKDQIDADWVVKKQAEGWRVTDVMIAGNSLTAHFGGQLSRRARGELEQLVEFLRAETKKERVAALAQ